MVEIVIFLLLICRKEENMHLHHIQYNGYVVIVDSLEEPLAIIHDGEGKLEFCRNFSDNVKRKITNYASSKKLI